MPAIILVIAPIFYDRNGASWGGAERNAAEQIAVMYSTRTAPRWRFAAKSVAVAVKPPATAIELKRKRERVKRSIVAPCCRPQAASETRTRPPPQERVLVSGSINISSDACTRLLPNSRPSVTAAIALWNTVYLGRALDDLRRGGEIIADPLLTHLAPVGWQHINLTGDYLWDSDSGLGPEGFRSLRTTATNPSPALAA